VVKDVPIVPGIKPDCLPKRTNCKFSLSCFNIGPSRRIKLGFLVRGLLQTTDEVRNSGEKIGVKQCKELMDYASTLHPLLHHGEIKLQSETLPKEIF